MVYTCGGKRTFDMTTRPIFQAFQEPDIPNDKRLDYYRGILDDNLEVKTDMPLELESSPAETLTMSLLPEGKVREVKRSFEEDEISAETQHNKRPRTRAVSETQTDNDAQNAVVFCKQCPYHCPGNPFDQPQQNKQPNPFPNPPQPNPFPNPQQPNPFPNPPQPNPFPNPQQPPPPLPQPNAPPRQQGPLPPPPQQLPGQQTIIMKLPTAYLGDVDLRVIPRGNNNYELIQDTAGVHVKPLILKIVDARQIPNFNPDNPPTANELATRQPKVINMETCQQHKYTLQSLRAKINRTASEEVAFYQALLELSGIDLLFLMGQYFAFLKEFCGIENVSNNESMFLVAVSNLANMDNAFAFYNSFYCGDGKTQFYVLSTTDVVSHEISHLLVAQTAGLVYQGHSGALNESYSDVFALFFERWLYMKFNEDADQSNNLLGSWNYTIGEACGRRLRTMRNFKNPLDAQQPCPAYYRGEAWGDPNSPADYGNVHSGSGVANKCAYEIIQLVGWDLAGKVLFSSLTKLKPNSSFIDYRDALKASASEFNCLDQVRLCLNTVGLTDLAVSDWTPKSQ